MGNLFRSGTAANAPHEGKTDRSLQFPDVLALELDELGGRPPAATGDAYRRALAAQLRGLAFSGGGIRSATFNLGVIQALAEHSLLRRFHYLSTVSGGGYIGIWLSALVSRATGGEVERAERAIAAASGLNPPQEKSTAPDVDAARAAHAILFLRKYSNYLTPRKRLLSGDTLAALGTYLRNLLINQTILVLLFGALMTGPYWAAWSVHGLGSLPYSLEVGLAGLAIAAALIGLCLWAVPARDDQGHGWIWAVQPRIVASSIALILLALWTVTTAIFAGVRPLFSAVDASAVQVGTTWPSRTELVTVFTVCYPSLWLIGSLVGMAYHLWRERHRLGEQQTSEPGDGHAPASISGPKAGEKMPSDMANPESRWPGWRNSTLVIFVAAVAGLAGGLFTYEVLSGIKDWGLQPRMQPFFAWVVSGLAFPALVVCAWLTLTLHTALASQHFLESRREWWARMSGIVLLICATWALLVLLTVVAAPAVGWGEWSLAASGFAWIFSTIGGVILGKSKLTAATIDKPGLLQTLSKVAPPIFILGFLFVIAWGLHGLFAEVSVRVADVDNLAWHSCVSSTPQPQREAPSDQSAATAAKPQVSFYELAVSTTCRVRTLVEGDWVPIGVINGCLVAFALLLGRVVSINLFSLNNFYGNRLTRCYVGASTEHRAPNPFTGLSSRDRVDFSDLGRDGPMQKTQRPIHIVNTALNLVAGKELAWQQRKAASFSFTPLCSGFGLPATADSPAKEAYWPTASYSQARGPSMGTLLAISGAATSPNMGYHSSPAMAFLLTVFNVRLGRWCPNPATEDASMLLRSEPRIGWWYLLRELFGLTNEDSGFVYLSDGGHFENLGLYELVRRRCKTIAVCDASFDPSYTFADLGNAIRKCRIDLGVAIRLNVDPIRIRKDVGFSTEPIAVGEIAYPEDGAAPSGRIFYVKASLTGNESTDLREFKANHPDFPHHKTSDQFFDEPTFESYRRLGHHIGGKLAQALIMGEASVGSPPAVAMADDPDNDE